MNTKETLIKARDILIERGVTRSGGYVSPDGCKVCALGAVQLALGAEVKITTYDDGDSSAQLLLDGQMFPFFRSESYMESAKTLNDAMLEIIKDTAHEDWASDITDYNDGSSDDAEVIAVFDRAIVLAE